MAMPGTLIHPCLAQPLRFSFKGAFLEFPKPRTGDPPQVKVPT